MDTTEGPASAGLPVKKNKVVLAECTLRRKCTKCKKKKTSFYCNTCFMGSGRKHWICSREHKCLDLYCERAHAGV